jgi:predicted ferric reductase
VRVTYHGLIPRFAKGKKATATYDPSADIVRLDITALLPDKTIKPGEYYYLYASNGIKSYQSHPFTLCSWREHTTTTRLQPPITQENAKTPHQTTLSTSSSPSTLTSTCRTNHTLLIRPHNGFTASLKAKARLSASPKDITVLLEGPYGPSLDLHPFTDVLFFVGGSGITAAISHLTCLLPSRRKETNIHLIWAVPNASLVENVCENELAATIRDPHFSMTVYETRGAKTSSHDGLEGKQAVDGIGGPAAPAYTLLQGRPDFVSAIRDARRDCVGRSLAVVSCGPPRLADACRKGVVEVLGDGEGKGTGVEFFNEAMAW